MLQGAEHGLDLLELGLLLLVPGFVSIKVWDLLVPSERRELTTTSLEVFAFGSITFAIFILPLLALEEQLYLEEVWKLSGDGAFESKIDRTAGIMVSYGDLYAVELFHGD